MFFKLTTPCSDCPWRTDIKFYLDPSRRQEFADALLNDGSFRCHKTLTGERDEDGVYQPTGNEQYCAGALIAMAKDNVLLSNRITRTAIRFGWLDPEQLDMAAPVYDSLEDFTQGP